MISSKYRFTLDMHTAQSQVSLPVVLYDTARRLYISLSDGGKLYRIEDGCLAVIRIDRPTGTYMEHFCPIEDNTNIVYDFAQNEHTAIVEGLHDCEVTLYGLDGGVVTTARFSMVVSSRVVNRDDIEITDEDWSLIDSIAAEEAKRQDGFNKAIADVEEAIEGIDDAINEIVPPYVGENGNWFVHGVDTGTKAQGEPGVYVGSGEMPEGYSVQIDPEGEALPFVISVNGKTADDTGNVEIDIITSDELADEVEAALGEARERGDFKGDKGDKGDPGEVGARGETGERGADGVSVTITNIVESQLDGGTNSVTFSDGNILHVKNGSAGSGGGEGGGGGIDAGQLSAAVEEALRLAKESGEFDGAPGPQGERGETGAVGPQGEKGADGYTPVKGTDYNTEADKAEMVQLVLAALPVWNGGSY